MSERAAGGAGGHEALIHTLAGSLKARRPLAPPARRAGLFLLAVLAVGIVTAFFSDFAMLRERFATVPDMWLAAVGACATGVLAAVAAFETSLPDRSARWALLPLPGLALWLGASGMGCLRSWASPAASHVPWMIGPRGCVMFIIGMAVPLSGLLIVMLRRGHSVRPGLTAALAGLTSAALVATLLNLFHPFDAGASDLALHVVTVSLVVVGNRLLGGRLLSRWHKRD